MNQLLTEAWGRIARLQEARTASTSETVIHALDLMIDHQIDRIAANHADPADPAEARRAIATATRRERHRARLARLHLAANALENHNQFFRSPPETIFAARQALTTIFGETSPQDAALLLSVGQGDAPQAPGLTASAARKRLCRLRARFSRLKLHAA